MKILISHIIEQLEHIHAGKLWIGPNLSRKLAVVNDDNAFIRPMAEMHSVAEIISHLTAWQYDAILKIEDGSGELKDGDPENWLPNKELRKSGWDHLWKDYLKSLDEFVRILKCKEDAFLTEQYFDVDFNDYYSYSFAINGILQHTIYHLGQIGLIIKLLDTK